MTERTLLREEDFGSGVLREAARLVNFVWLLARVHRRPEALRFFALVVKALAPFGSPEAICRGAPRKIPGP